MYIKQIESLCDFSIDVINMGGSKDGKDGKDHGKESGEKLTHKDNMDKSYQDKASSDKNFSNLSNLGFFKCKQISLETNLLSKEKFSDNCVI